LAHAERLAHAGVSSSRLERFQKEKAKVYIDMPQDATEAYHDNYGKIKWGNG